jgi:hypothetical protein
VNTSMSGAAPNAAEAMQTSAAATSHETPVSDAVRLAITKRSPR